MKPRPAALLGILLATASAAVSHVFVRSAAASPGFAPVPLFASALALAAVGMLLYAALVRSDKRRAARNASLLAVQFHVLVGVLYLASLLLVPADGPAGAFRGYGLSFGGWIAAILMWPFAAPWTAACLGGIVECP